MASKDCIEKHELTDEYLEKMNAYWRAANYLSAAQLYMLDNPLLKSLLQESRLRKNRRTLGNSSGSELYIHTLTVLLKDMTSI